MTSPRTDAMRSARGGVGRVARAALCGLVLMSAAAAHAAEAGSSPRWVAVSFLAGTAQPVASLADYQWNVRPHAAWGTQALVGRGPLAVGLRLWRTSTTQSLGLAGTPDPSVSSTSLESVGRARVAHWRSLEGVVLASGGRLALRYHPDHITVDAGGGPFEVAFEPITEWVAGAGLGVRAPLVHGWSVGLETERRFFSLDTAHRNGSGVQFARETFGDWHVRLGLERAWGW